MGALITLSVLGCPGCVLNSLWIRNTGGGCNKQWGRTESWFSSPLVTGSVDGAVGSQGSLCEAPVSSAPGSHGPLCHEVIEYESRVSLCTVQQLFPDLRLF